MYFYKVISPVLPLAAHFVDKHRYPRLVDDGTSRTAGLSTAGDLWLIDYYWLHPEWDPDNLNSPDVGLLQTSDIGFGSIERHVTLATNSEVYRLRVGAPIATLGFPGELQGGETEDISPIATFKNGTISALRPPYQGDTYTSRDTYIVQHNLDLSGGTSGSPIFDARGRVVAINNAGIDVIFDIGGRQARVSQAALGFGIRADKIRELLNQASVAAKRTVPAKPAHFDELVSRLEGRDISVARHCDDAGGVCRAVGADAVSEWHQATVKSAHRMSRPAHDMDRIC